MLDHVILNFDPAADEDTAKVFRDRTARTFYLLWRTGHLVGPGFAELSLQVGKLIDERDPQTAEELTACFPPVACEFSQHDVGRFCSEALPYLLGKQTVTYKVVD